MKVSKLFNGIKILNKCDLDLDIKEVKKNSKNVKQGDIFFDLSSSYECGLKNCQEALSNGAVMVVSENRLPLKNLCLVQDSHSAFSSACENYYDEPSKKMKIIGITGTNGKTTCAHLISEMLKGQGKNVGTIGTMGVKFAGQDIDYSMTTPDADDLQRTFYEMQKSGVEYVVMEVSAHAIAQRRVEGVKFEVGVLTNITQDHLDYFGTMENYRDCKLSFFTDEYIKSAVVSSDDESGRELLKNIKAPALSFGLQNPADVFAVKIKGGLDGAEFYGNILDDVYKVKTNLVGEYNVSNVLASLSVMATLGFDVSKAVESLKTIKPVEGRFNVIKYKGKYIVIDFAHTPDGLENVLKTAKKICKGKLYCVFGCGGNRDSGKRPKMGAIAEKYSDYVCVTNDNPRFENPTKIASDIEKGMRKSHFVELDRQSAIEKMISLSKKDDIILIAGKGGEKYQIVGDKKLDYNDFDAVYKIIKNDVRKEIKEKYGN